MSSANSSPTDLPSKISKNRKKSVIPWIWCRWRCWQPCRCGQPSFRSSTEQPFCRWLPQSWEGPGWCFVCSWLLELLRTANGLQIDKFQSRGANGRLCFSRFFCFFWILVYLLKLVKVALVQSLTGALFLFPCLELFWVFAVFGIFKDLSVFYNLVFSCLFWLGWVGCWLCFELVLG